MTINPDTSKIRNKLVIKAVRDIRQAGKKENVEKGMYRPEIKLDLQRSRLLTESYKETGGKPMVIRRAKALEKILSQMDLYIQDWEKIVGNCVSTPEGLYFGIDMNWPQSAEQWMKMKRKHCCTKHISPSCRCI